MPGLARNGIVIGAIGALALTVGSLGVATAANGGSLVLGHKNTATKTTTLTDKKGTPLSLVGKTSKPPLTVNSSKQVSKLNASLLDGKSASAIATAGAAVAEAVGGTAGVGVHENATGGSEAISASQATTTLIASLGSLPAGTYFMQSSTETNESGTAGTFCYIGTTENPSDGFNYGQAASSTAGFATESVSTTVTLTTPTTVGSYCFTDGSTSVWYNGSISALKITKSVN
jgi:hypothetical protein